MTKNRNNAHVWAKKKLLPMLLAVLMVTTLVAPGMVSSAAEMDKPPQIIINAPTGLVFDDATDFFQAFKIFDVTFAGDNYSYVIVPAFEAFDDYPGADSTYSLLDFLNDGPTAAEMTDLAAALWTFIYYEGYDPNDIVRLVEPVGDVDIEESQVTIDLDVTGGGYGYYLVFHSATLFDDDEPFVQIVAACALTTTNPIAEVTAKTDVPTLKKWLVLDDGTYAKVEGLSIGDIASFAIEVTLPTTFEGYDDANPYVLVVHDVLGVCPEFFLGFDPEGDDGFVENITVSYWEQGEPTTIVAFVVDDDYELTPGPYGFEIEFSFDALQAIPEGYSILIEYSAVVNEGIRETLKGSNSAWVEFSRDPYGDETGITPPSVVTIYVTGLGDIVKVDGNTGEEIEGTWFEKINDLNMPITGETRGIAFSPDGKYFAVTQAFASPYISIYDISSGIPEFTSYPNEQTQPYSNSVAYSYDGAYMAVAASWGGLTLYDMTGITPTKITDSYEQPNGGANGVAFSPDGKYMAIAYEVSPYIMIYDMTGEIPTKIPGPDIPPTGYGKGVAFSPDGQYLAIAHDESPYVTIFDMTGGTPTKIGNPTELPTGWGMGVAFSPDGQLLAIAHYNSPFVTIYDMTSGSPIKIDNPTELPTGDGHGAAFSPDGKYLVVGHDNSPFITIYSMTSSTPTKTENPNTLPTGEGLNAAFSPDGQFLAITNPVSPYITIYRTPTPASTTYSTLLTGAEFELYKLTTLDTPDTNGLWYDIGAAIPFSEDSSGNLLFDGNPNNEDDIFYTLMSDPEVAVTGIGPGLYMLRETVAPDGYNKLTYDIFFEITLEYDDDTEEWVYVKKVYFDTANTFLITENAPTFDAIFDSINGIFETIYIENFSGTLFPGTGGIGTAIFYATSLLLTTILITGYALTRKRKSSHS